MVYANLSRRVAPWTDSNNFVELEDVHEVITTTSLMVSIYAPRRREARSVQSNSSRANHKASPPPFKPNFKNSVLFEEPRACDLVLFFIFFGIQHKFTLVYCESVNLVGAITVYYPR